MAKYGGKIDKEGVVAAIRLKAQMLEARDDVLVAVTLEESDAEQADGSCIHRWDFSVQTLVEEVEEEDDGGE